MEEAKQAKRYVPLLGIRETEKEIKSIKDFFQAELARSLALQRVSAPIIVRSGTGVNDDLNGVEHKVAFTIPDDAHAKAEIVFSLAKWKRLALAEYGFAAGEGLYTDMNAIRPDETLDEFHSLYVDQWDWEKIILPGERSLATLKAAVRQIYGVIKATEAMVCSRHPLIKPFLPEEITFIHAEDLRSMYPHLTPKQREDEIAMEKGAVFVIGIGGALADGKPHDGRAPDYDDWITETGDGKRGLNGDIIVWYPPLAKAMELSSMGIRVDSASLSKQLEIRKAESRMRLRWHSRLLAGQLPQTMGGGIGQSRLCMMFLQKLHIGEVQASIWPERIADECARKGVRLL
jgi:aspartate--ammonia ligase